MKSGIMTKIWNEFILLSIICVYGCLIACGETDTGTGNNTDGIDSSNSENNDENNNENNNDSENFESDTENAENDIESENDNDGFIVFPWKDPDTEYMWSERYENLMQYFMAESYCEGYKEGGFSDWRLPTISELRTLITDCPDSETGGACGVTDDCLGSNTCYDKNCYSCGGEIGDSFSKIGDIFTLWSASDDPSISINVWVINYSNGSIESTSYNGVYDLRCVR